MPTQTLASTQIQIEVDLDQPSIISLKTRNHDDQWSRNLLAQHVSDGPAWARFAGTRLVDEDATCFASEHSQQHQSNVADDRITISNIRPSTPEGTPGPATETWTLQLVDNKLQWHITRQFNDACSLMFDSTPGFYFNIRANRTITMAGQDLINPEGNGVAMNLWAQTDALAPLNLAPFNGRPEGWLGEFFPEFNTVAFKNPDAFAIWKLFSSFPLDHDLKATSQGGHLFRRGRYNAFCEAGITTSLTTPTTRTSGQTDETILTLEPLPATASGWQLQIDIPEKQLATDLQRFLGQQANAGCLADNYHHLLGNETDGHLYTGIPIFHARSLMASAPAAEPLSSSPLDYGDAFRKYLEFNMQHISEKGDIRFGFRHGGLEFIELSMTQLIGCEAHLLSTGDRDFAHRYIHAFDAMRSYLQSWIRNGVFYIPKHRMVAPTGCANWYYDSVPAHGYTLYHSILYHRTLTALETIYNALGEEENAEEMADARGHLRRAIRHRFWDDDAYGPAQGGFYDWVTPEGNRKGYFFAVNQYGTIVNGIASQGQARQLLATADARIEELIANYHYSREATLDTLWPFESDDSTVVDRLKGPNGDSFGTYMNGGSLIAMTLLEIAARCLAGDPDGAHALLTAFGQHAGQTNWFEGENAFAINGQPCGWGGEPYLADGLCAPAALIFGFLGCQFDWHDIRLNPQLPQAWPQMGACIQYKGQTWQLHAQHNGSWSKTLISKPC